MKRFTETAKWADPWFMGLSLDAKLVFWYITENCDNAGVWDPNCRLANFCFQRDIEWDRVREELGDRLEVLPNGKWWLVKFVPFQCGELSEACKPHQKVIGLLAQNGLLERVSKGYAKSSQRDKEEEEDKEEEKEKDKPARRIIPPTPEQVTVYSAEIGYPMDGQAWCDSYAQKGWMVGKNKMRDWQSAVRNWKTNKWKPGEPINGSSNNDGRNSRSFEMRGDYSQIKNKL